MVTGNALRELALGLVGAEAQGKNRKRKSKNKKTRRQNDAIEQQVFARCVSQVPACEAEIRRNCNNGPACIARALPCCQPLTTCAFATFFTCAEEALSAL